MSELSLRIEKNIHVGLQKGVLSNDNLVQIIERCGSMLNLQTISSYAKSNSLSYNEVKNNREVINLFGVKLVVDNH